MSSNTETKVRVAGDVIIRDVTIVTLKGSAQTILPQVIGMEIYEDIFSTFVTGRIYVKDSQELTNLLPLVGEEVIRLDVITPSLDDKYGYSAEYFIYKMEDKVKIREREVAYVLHFISKQAILDLNKKISAPFKGKVSDIAQKLITDSIVGLEVLDKNKSENVNNINAKFVNIEPTKNETKFISNFWSPVKCLQYACESSLNQADSPSYVFYETKDSFNYVSLDSLYDKPLAATFMWDNYTNENINGYGRVIDLDKDYKRILDIQTPLSFNYIDRLKSGMFGSEMVTYDLMTHQYSYQAWKPEFSKTKHLNDKPLWSESMVAPGSKEGKFSRAKSVLMVESKYYNNFEGFDDVTNTRFMQQRKSLMAQAEAQKIQITVFGRTDYSVGQKIYVAIPKSTQISNENRNDAQDKMLSGNYIISALCHHITPESHQCVMELIKDSYVVDLNNA